MKTPNLLLAFFSAGVICLLLVFSTINLKNLFSKEYPLPLNTNFDSQIFFRTPESLYEPHKDILKELPGKIYSKLDGQTVINDFNEEKPICLAMIENHPDSRNQLIGLTKAAIIYETPVEGGITRFMAIYNDCEEKNVGPIRSARPYFVDFAEEFGGLYIHAGGSAEALGKLQKVKKLLNIEGLYYEELGKYLYRNKKYKAPHNLFADLSEINTLKKVTEKKFTLDKGFLFGKNETKSTPIKKIEIDFSVKAYEVKYEYDEKNNKYLRYLAQKKHLEDGKEFHVSNILIQIVDYSVIDNVGRLKLKEANQGEAILFTGGQMFEGNWEKNTEGITKFFDKNGNEFKLTPGQTWITPTNKEAVSFE